jgi:formate dehydrogenase subunit gamma
MVFLHDVAFIATGAMFFLHVYLSVIHPLMRGAWSSMARGKVSTEYARSHHAKWYEEEVARPQQEVAKPEEAAKK